jgi:hypothetical protein
MLRLKIALHFSKSSAASIHCRKSIKSQVTRPPKNQDRKKKRQVFGKPSKFKHPTVVDPPNRFAAQVMISMPEQKTETSNNLLTGLEPRHGRRERQRLR